MIEEAQDIPRIREEAREWLVCLNSDEVTPEGRMRFEAWLRTSERHAQAYQRVKSLWSGIAQLTDLAELEPLDQPLSGERLRAIFRQARQVVGRAFMMPALPFTAGAVAAILLVLAPNLSRNLFLAPTPVQNTPVQYATVQYATGVAETRDVPLPDGSVVTVGARSKIEVNFRGDERRVVLTEGEAFFSVQKDPGRPFYVAAGQTLIRVTGTKFDVRHEPGNVRAAVLEGTVEVMRSAQASGSSAPDAVVEKHVITAGQQVVSDPSGVRQSQGVEPGAWRHGQLVYVDASLDEVIADANRYYDKTIVFGAEALAGLRVTGAYRTNQIDVMLASLAKVYPIEIKQTNDGRIILKFRRG
jgi:transmembrane sensor